MNSAILLLETGEIFYISEFGDSDDLPDDIYDPKYIEIPHKNELNLGRPLVLEFTVIHMPEDFDQVASTCLRRGAYAIFKNLLNSKRLLAEWYEFE